MKKQLLKVTKLYRLLYGGGHKLTPRHTNICKFLELCGAIPLLAKDVITFKFGNNFTNIEVLFSVVSTGFL